MDHHAGRNHASSGSQHGDHTSHDHVTVLPVTTPHPHNHAEHVRAATAASTLQIPTPDGTDWFHGTTEGLNSRDHNHHHLDSHSNDLDLNSENVPGDHNHGDHLQPAASEAHGDMMDHGMGHMKVGRTRDTTQHPLAVVCLAGLMADWLGGWSDGCLVAFLCLI